MTTSPGRRLRTSTSPDILAHLAVRRGAGAPLHKQIYEGMRGAILSGSLRSGQRVPSTRMLAIELRVSRLPVLAAYEQLLHEGYLRGRVGSGTFVSEALPDDLLRLHPAVHKKPRALPAPREEGGRRPFRVSLPALDQFPLAAWARIVARHAHAMTPTLMAYGDPAGLGTLRSAIAEHLRTSRAVQCEAEHVLIVPGSQAALRLCAAVLLAPGNRVAVEEPGYLGAQLALTAGGARVEPVAVDSEGIDVDALVALGSRVRAAYVTPSHQYPLGVSMSVARRLALLSWADRGNKWIIEDDYDSEYRYVSRPLASLQGMCAQRRVIYIGTFSKVLFPALRVGYVVVPPALWSEFVGTREAFDLFSPTLYQRALADFINEGAFVRHLRRMRVLYASRRQALLAGLARHCDGLLTVDNCDAGLHIATVLRRGVDDAAVVREMAAHGLTATALSSCYVRRAKRSGLLLGFGGWDERRIGDATRTLGEVLREFS